VSRRHAPPSSSHCRDQRQAEARELERRERFVQQPHRERRGDREAQAENRRVDADRATLKAARETVKAGVDEESGRRTPQRGEPERKRAA
jgi:hypothetical protein